MDDLVPDITSEPDLTEEEQVAAPEENSVAAQLVKFRSYGPAVGDKPTRAVTHGPLGALQPGDIAVAPNMLHDHPLGSYMAINTPNGVIHGRVADTSWVDEGHPNHNTVEFWNRQPPADSGYVAPISVQQIIESTPERARLAGDQPTAASIENAMPDGSGQAPDITSPDTGAPDMTSGADVQDIADQVTENLKAQQPEAQSTEETAPIPTDPSKMQYDPEHDMASWEFNGKRWYIARGMTKPAELKAPVSHRRIITDPATQSQWSVDPDHPEDAKPLNLPGNPGEVDISKVKEGDWNSVPEALRGQAQLYASYRGPKVSGFALAKPYFNKLFAIIAKVDPSFDQKNYDLRQDTLKDFGPKGKSGQNITSFNTAMDHLGGGMEESDALKEALGQGKSKFVNYLQNLQMPLTGKGAESYNEYMGHVGALRNEVERATSGGQPHEGSKEGWDAILSPSTSPDARIAGMAAMASLMGARLEENRQAYKRGFGGEEPRVSFLSPKAEETLKQAISRIPDSSPTKKRVQGILDTFGSQGGKRPYVDPQTAQDPQAHAELTHPPVDQEAPYGGRQTVRRLNPDQSNPAEAHVIYDAETKKFLGYEP